MTAPAPSWIPECLLESDPEPQCRWLDMGRTRCSEPFFDMTLARRRRDRPPQFTSTLGELIDRAADVPSVCPSAVIFHVSRCGSTLFGQLAALDPETLVLSEVPLLDAVLRAPRLDREALFDAVLRLMVQGLAPGAARVVIKTDCWHLFHADVLRRCYPGVPFVLLFRSPDDVLASHRRIRGMHMVPGLLDQPPFTVPYEPSAVSLDQYAAGVLAEHFRAMSAAALSLAPCRLVNYAEGFPKAYLETTAWLGWSLDDSAVASIVERCGYHAKHPHEVFRGDAPVAPHDVDTSILHSLYSHLDALRRWTRADGAPARERHS